MHLAVFSNNVAANLVESGRVVELLEALCCPNVHVIAGRVRASCPMCEGRLAVYINDTDKDRRLPIGWSCSQDCHRKWHPSILGLAHAALSAADDGEKCSVNDAVAFLREFLQAR